MKVRLGKAEIIAPKIEDCDPSLSIFVMETPSLSNNLVIQNFRVLQHRYNYFHSFKATFLLHF